MYILEEQFGYYGLGLDFINSYIYQTLFSPVGGAAGYETTNTSHDHHMTHQNTPEI